jgi:hypothetical protein
MIATFDGKAGDDNCHSNHLHVARGEHIHHAIDKATSSVASMCFCAQRFAV